MSKRGTQSAYSANCIADVDASKCRYSGTVTTKPATAPIIAIQRAKPASRSRPKPSTAKPATIGTQIASDRYGVVKGAPTLAASPLRCPRRGSNSTLGAARRVESPDVPPVEQSEDADDHHERVVVDIAGLDAPEFARDEADELRRAIDGPAVDDRPVAVVRRETSEPARPAGKEPVVETIEVVLVVEQRVDRPAARDNPGRQRGIDEIEVHGGGDAGDREPERRGREAMQDEG